MLSKSLVLHHTLLNIRLVLFLFSGFVTQFFGNLLLDSSITPDGDPDKHINIRKETLSGAMEWRQVL